MLADDLRERLKSLTHDISIITTFWKNSGNDTRLDSLEEQSKQDDFWKNPEQGEILKELQALKNKKEDLELVLKTHTDLGEFLDLFGEDDNQVKELVDEVGRHCGSVRKLKVLLLLNQPDDTKNCFFSINAGAGGTESQDWCEMLVRMYVRFCEREKLTAQVIDLQTGEGAGLKSAVLFIKGKNVHGLLESEQGIHRLVRISPFDANKRRHTSFVGVSLTAEAPDIQITIDPSDLRIDTYRAGGAGGQHVNKTDSAVRITHIPSGIVVQCQNERSQLQNKETAMKMLKAKLYEKEQEERQNKLSAVEKKKIEWGSQIRSYVLHPYKMVKDHRTDFESMQPDDVLDGDLMGFIESYLLWRNQK